MSVTRTALIATLVVAALAISLAGGPGTVAAQTPLGADMRSAEMSASASKAADDVSRWTRRQWNAAKAKWSQERTKWDACNRKATAQKLTGRRSWSFIANCMSS
jgi:hypothetical protein